MIYDIILNIEKSGIKPRIKVSQYDKTLPQIRATLYSNNQAFNIPSGSTVYISGTKKDNTGFKYECTYSNNEITADITEQMTAFSGDVEVEFTIENSGSRKGTENFILEVEKAALEDDVVISETDIPAIQRLSQPASTTQLGVVKVDGTTTTIDSDGTLHSSGGGGGSVISVNGKTGVVVLDADDIDDTNTTNKFTNATEKQAWNGKSTVSVTQIKSSGEKIATINVNGTDTDLFASAGGGGGGAVDSVNGKTGDVVLTASDVGALADDTPIPSDLSDLSDVDTSGVTDGDALIYDSTSGKWVNGSGGGGTSDYSQLSNKPSINGVTLSGNKTSADLSIFAPTITSPTNGQVIKYDGSNWVNGSVSGGSNRNLLDNPWFTVNQKGFSSGAISYTINDTFIDRWLNYQNWRGFSYSIGSDGLTFTKVSGQGGNMGQKFENSLSYGTYTLSILLSDNTMQSFVCTLSNDEPTVRNYTTLNGVVCTLVLSTTSLTIYSDGAYTGTFTVRAIKLELGTESTLALDVAPNYTEELLKCQRYYYPLSDKSYNSMVSAMQQTRQFMTITLPTEMRAVPTFNGSLTTEGISGSTRVDDTVTSSNITVTNKQGIEFNFTTSNNFNLCSSARVSFLSDSYLSAEL